MHRQCVHGFDNKLRSLEHDTGIIYDHGRDCFNFPQNICSFKLITKLLMSILGLDCGYIREMSKSNLTLCTKRAIITILKLQVIINIFCIHSILQIDITTSCIVEVVASV